MMVIPRKLNKIVKNKLFTGKAIIIYGPRQVGKTTLLRQLEDELSPFYATRYLNCEEPDIRQALTDQTSTDIQHFIGPAKLVLLDEAQRVRNIGVTIKLLVDTYPDIQIIATGSSSFDLSNQLKEPLTGRAYEYHLYPLSVTELMQELSSQEMKRLLDERLVLGMYPEIVRLGGTGEELLRSITQSYVFKDALEYSRVKDPNQVQRLLQALALQVGQAVSSNELAGVLGLNRDTINHYLMLLEQSFIVFRLPSFSRNLRTELRRSRKIYFYDNGLRNALINNLNPLHLRSDVGALWENWLIAERLKFHRYQNRYPNQYFWRTHAQQELDYIEEESGNLRAFEFKWSTGKLSVPKAWKRAYPDASVELINRDNALDWLTE